MAGTWRTLRASPWRRGTRLLWRDPVLGGLVLAVGALAGFVAASTPLYASSVSVASMEQQLAPLCVASSVSPFTRVPVGDARAELDRLAAAQGGVFAAPVQGRVAARRADSSSPAELVLAAGATPVAFATRTGFEAHLQPGQRVGPGLHLPQSLATQAGVEPGDTVTFTGGGGSQVTLPVAGVFDDLTNRPDDPFWCPLQPAVQPQLNDEFSPSPAVVVDENLFDRLVEDLGLRVTFQEWEAPLAVDLTDHAAATEAAAAVTRLQEEAAPLRLSITSRLAFLVERAAAMRASVAAGVAPVILLSLVAAGGLVAGTALLWSVRRRTELRLLWARGVPPCLLAVKAAAEVTLTIAAGAVAGWALAWPLVGAFGPGSSVEPAAARTALLAALLAGAAAVVLAAVVVGARMRLAPLASSVPRHRRVPWWPVLAAGLVWSWWRLSSLTLAVPDGDELPPIPWETFVVPVVFLVSATALAVLGLRQLLGLGAARARRLPTVAYLAVRRIAAASTVVLVLCAAAGLAIGVVTYGAGLAGSSQRTVDLKLGLGNGAPTVAYLLPPGVPPDLAGRATTTVLRKASYGGEEVELLAIDPDTFADGAVWDASLADESLPDLLGRLGPAGADGRVPALATGPAVAATGELTFPLQGPEAVPLTVVATPAAFSGMDGRTPLLVVDARAVAEPLANVAPHLWTAAEPGEVRASALANRQRVVWVSTPEGRVSTSVFQPVVWIARFVQAVGVLIAVLAAAALLAYLGAGRRGRALAAELLRRMGLGLRRQWLVAVIELGVLGLLALVTGVVAGWVSVTALRSLVDAAPSVPPAAVLRFPTPAVAWAVAGGLLVIVVGAAVATVMASRAPMAELLRDDL